MFNLSLVAETIPRNSLEAVANQFRRQFGDVALNFAK
jgi:hypothetical protein